MQLKENKRYMKGKKIATSYRTSIKDEDLKIFIAAEWVECSPLEELAESQNIWCVKERCKREATGEELYLVNQPVEFEAIQMHISKAEDRIRSLRRVYLQALQEAGNGDVIQTKPHIAINRFLKKLKSFHLYSRILNMITRKKDENLHEENFDWFATEVAFQTTKIQGELMSMPVQERLVIRDSYANKKRSTQWKGDQIWQTQGIVNIMTASKS